MLQSFINDYAVTPIGEKLAVYNLSLGMTAIRKGFNRLSGSAGML
jgi:hypothetical protein